MADLLENVSVDALRKSKQGSSLELLIGKLKTAPISLDGLADSITEHNGTPPPVVAATDKKSRRKGNPVSYMVTAQYEPDEDMEVDETAPGVEVQIDSEQNDINAHSASYCKAESMDTGEVPPDKPPKARVEEDDVIPEGTVVVNPEAPTAEQESSAPQIDPEMQGSDLALVQSSQSSRASTTSHCTTCKEVLYVKQPENIKEHPKLKVIVCKTCYVFYSSGDFTKDEDGLDNQCSWCGEGGNLLICDCCTSAFCKKCIRNNFKRDMLLQIMSAKKWKCLMCDPKPLAALVLRSTELQKKVKEHLKAVMNRATPKPRGPIILNDIGPASSRRGSGGTNSSNAHRHGVRVPGQQIVKTPVRQVSDRRVQQVPSRQAQQVPSRQAQQVSSRQAQQVVGRQAQQVPNRQAQQVPNHQKVHQGHKIVHQRAAEDKDSRIHINLPEQLPGQDKARLSINLSTVAAQYINSQNVRCNFGFLEQVVQEHNRFSNELKVIKDSLIEARNKYQALMASAKSNPEVVNCAKVMYRNASVALGNELKRYIATNVTNAIRLVSSSPSTSATDSSGAAAKVPSPPPQTTLPLLPEPPKTSLLAVGSTRATSSATASNVSRTSSGTALGPIDANALMKRFPANTNREFIDLDELNKVIPKYTKVKEVKEVIDLCSDDDSDTEQLSNEKSVSKQSSNKTLTIQQSSNKALASHKPSSDVSASQSGSDDGVPGVQLTSKSGSDDITGQAAASECNGANKPDECHSPLPKTEALHKDVSDSVTEVEERPISPQVSSSGLAVTSTQMSSSSDDDLVGVTPRETEKESVAETEVTSTSSKEKIRTEDECSDSDNRTKTRKGKQRASKVIVQASSKVAEDLGEPKPGPSGLSRRALKRLLRSQAAQESTTPGAESPDDNSAAEDSPPLVSEKTAPVSKEPASLSDDEGGGTLCNGDVAESGKVGKKGSPRKSTSGDGANKAVSKKSALTKEFISSSDDDDDKDDVDGDEDAVLKNKDKDNSDQQSLIAESAKDDSSAEENSVRNDSRADKAKASPRKVRRRLKRGSEKSPTKTDKKVRSMDVDDTDSSADDKLATKGEEKCEEALDKVEGESDSEHSKADTKSARLHRTTRVRDKAESGSDSETEAAAGDRSHGKTRSADKVKNDTSKKPQTAEKVKSGSDTEHSESESVTNSERLRKNTQSRRKPHSDSDPEGPTAASTSKRRSKRTSSTRNSKSSEDKGQSKQRKSARNAAKDSQQATDSDDESSDSDVDKGSSKKSGDNSDIDKTISPLKKKYGRKNIRPIVDITSSSDSDGEAGTLPTNRKPKTKTDAVASETADSDAVASEGEDDGLLEDDSQNTVNGVPDLPDDELGEVLDDRLLDSDGDEETPKVTEPQKGSPSKGTAVSGSKKESQETDATLSDDLANAQAMKELQAELTDSDSDNFDPPPRTFLRRRAKTTPKIAKKSRPKERLTTEERQERKVKKLNPDQRRYMRRRATGLLISLKEKKQSRLQRLLSELAVKTTAEIDTENKLGMKCELKVEKIDPDNKENVKRLIEVCGSAAARSAGKSVKKDTFGEESEANSDVEKEIKRLSKLHVLLKKAGAEKEYAGRKRGRRKGEERKDSDRRKKKEAERESLSDISSNQSKSEPEDSDSNEGDNSNDIILIPNKDQLDNEDAMRALLHHMSDSEGEQSEHSTITDSESDSSVKEKRPNNKGSKPEQRKRKVHPLEQEGFEEKSKGKGKGKHRRRLSSNSGGDSDLDRGTDSSDSIVINRRGKKRQASSSSGSGSEEVAEQLTTRGRANKMVKKKKRVVRPSSSSSGSGSSSSSGSSKGSSSSGSDSDVKLAKSKGRHKIRKVLDDGKLKETTKSAHKLEMERRKRIEEKQKQYNEEILKKGSPMKEHKASHMVLERSEKGRPIIEVDQTLVRKLKPHQVEAVKFMWDCVCETVERSKKGEGGGCILAHCMGLGKTLSLITFVHTLLSHEDKLKLTRILVIAPLNTVLNWKDEVNKWTANLEIDIDVDELQAAKRNIDRMHRLKRWYNTGGIMILGYEMFRNLTSGKHIKKKEHKEKFLEYLINPGPHIVICDEGHLLKNAKSGVRKAVMQIETKRRIVLTGTPLQNNLKEYGCMVDFVKPSLLGTEAEFNNRFIAPITNGQYEDSTPYDVKLMKKRAHVLHEMLAGCVQRQDYSALTKFLPPKSEYILSIKLSELQVKLYQIYMDKILDGSKLGVRGKLFQDYQTLSKVWTHPMVLELHRRDMEDHDSFIDDTTGEETPSASGEDTDVQVRDSDGSCGSWKPTKKKAKKDPPEKPKLDVNEPATSGTSTPVIDQLWWKDPVKDVKLNDISLGFKFVLLLEILKKCEEIGDRILVFSQSLKTLDLIEDFLEMVHEAVVNADDEIMKTLYGSGKWQKGVNYFRIDGSVDAKLRAQATNIFNRPNNLNARLFLISTRAGGMGINLVGANRVIIFDASWNPSHDVQAIFRAYRFGQKKPVYIYRFLARGTMEEKIYERQIAKLSLSERVVDERQIDRHFTANDLNELYNFKPGTDEPSETPALPKDLLLADLLNTHGYLIKKVMEHDSLLENKVEEQLSEEERKAAWQEFQQEKDKVVVRPPPLEASNAGVGFTPNPASAFNNFVTDAERTQIQSILYSRFPEMHHSEFEKMVERHCQSINHDRFVQFQQAFHRQPGAGASAYPKYNSKHVQMMQEKKAQQQYQQNMIMQQRQQQQQQQQQYLQRFMYERQQQERIAQAQKGPINVDLTVSDTHNPTTMLRHNPT